jgi:arginine/lysine/ornithine decarboxylase
MAAVALERLFRMRALMVNDSLHGESAGGHAAGVLAEELARREVDMVFAENMTDASAIAGSDMALQVIVMDWDHPDDADHAGAQKLLSFIRGRNPTIPIFLTATSSSAASIPVKAMEEADDFIWLLEDTPQFVAGRIIAAIDRYRATILPPMFAALVDFSRTHEYSWHTPGHAGGTAFLKHPAGRAFFQFFGEELFRSDLSISVGSLGSLLDHSGPIGAGERYTAHIFGAHRTYYVTNGSSTSNRIILMSSVTRDQIALCDRNCHKSIEHSMTMSGAIPTYLVPTRNRLGLIGPIPGSRLTAAAIKKAIANNPLVTKGIDPTPVHAVITNSTYDGLCYNVKQIEKLLGGSVDRLHFDEAWYGYARFNPLYRDRHAMHGPQSEHDPKGPTVFATHSTHKLLAALSQASYIHIRDGRRPIPHDRFNEAFMMHSSTSPQYAIIASCDIAAAMMDGPYGPALTTDCIREAVTFRQKIAQLNAEFAAKKQWFFSAFQPDKVADGRKSVPFHQADPERLISDPQCWVLHPGQAWHGFEGLDEDYCMLDPIKMSIVTPGVGADGKMGSFGIPASIVTAYLSAQGIQVEKTTDFTILFLFSLGITKGKWGTLLNALLDFKRDFDANAPLDRVLPAVMAAGGDTYMEGGRPIGLRDLAQRMFGAMVKLGTTRYLAKAFSIQPKAVLSPVRAYEVLVRGDVEIVTLDRLADRTVATGIVPYPPGIPLMMPGESAGAADGPILGYLRSLEAYDRLFPGFGHDTHGVENHNGTYRVQCLKGKARS